MATSKTFTELQKVLRSAGKFEDTVAYGMPALRYKTKIVACYVECKAHIGYYPYSGTVIRHFKSELKGYKTSIGAVQFPKDKKIPVALVKKMVRERMKEIEKQLSQKKK